MGLCGNVEPNCTLWSIGIDYSKYEADPDIAGIGVISAFVATSFVTVAIAHTSLFLGIVPGYEDNAIDTWFFAQLQKVPFLRARDERTKFWQPIMEALVLALSDQQLLVGLSILTAGFVKHCTISVYHFSIVYDLVWFSSNTHMTSLNVLRVYLRSRASLRNWRVCLMLAVFIAMIVATVLSGHRLWYDSWNSSAQCLFDDLQGNIQGEPARWMAAQIFLLVYGYGVAILRLYKTEALEHLLDKFISKMRSAQSAIRNNASSYEGIGSLIVLIILVPLDFLLGVAIKGCMAVFIFIDSMTISLFFDVGWFAFGLMSIIEDRNIPAAEMDGNENEWGFGQLVPVLLLSSVVLSFKELHTGNDISCLSLTGQRSAEPNADQIAKLREQNGNVGGDLRRELSEPDKMTPDSASKERTESEVSELAHIPPKRVDTEAGGHEANACVLNQDRSTQH
ncbi:MAG: hypothetical protein Q9179_002428 [Wetmoreana sp. 5 TL-2023]